jgi:hypothetical protein
MGHFCIVGVFMLEDCHFVKTYSAFEMKVVAGAWVSQESVSEDWPVSIAELRLVDRRFWVENAVYGQHGCGL